MLNLISIAPFISCLRHKDMLPVCVGPPTCDPRNAKGTDMGGGNKVASCDVTTRFSITVYCWFHNILSNMSKFCPTCPDNKQRPLDTKYTAMFGT